MLPMSTLKPWALATEARARPIRNVRAQCSSRMKILLFGASRGSRRVSDISSTQTGLAACHRISESHVTEERSVRRPESRADRVLQRVRQGRVVRRYEA